MENKKQRNKVESTQVKLNVSLLVLQTKSSTWSISGNVLDLPSSAGRVWSFCFFFFLNMSVLSQNWTNVHASLSWDTQMILLHSVLINACLAPESSSFPYIQHKYLFHKDPSSYLLCVQVLLCGSSAPMAMLCLPGPAPSPAKVALHKLFTPLGSGQLSAPNLSKHGEIPECEAAACVFCLLNFKYWVSKYRRGITSFWYSLKCANHWVWGNLIILVSMFTYISHPHLAGVTTISI